ncbi:hypothetical protein [Rufibacter sp. LB8]|uniref:hypothetical protein n=1 Tax=Rufibacter sp. LB8 TaxID=2777781 RepID=UPI00178C7BD3|nr:hypothetical protein [Rufibacter sp. LB8]
MTANIQKDFFKQPRHLSAAKAELLQAFLLHWVAAVTSSAPVPSTVDLLLIDFLANPGPDELSEVPALVLKSIFLESGPRRGVERRLSAFFYDASKVALQRTKLFIEAVPLLEELPRPPLFLQTPQEHALLQESLAAPNSALIILDPFAGKVSQELWINTLNRPDTHFLVLLEPSKLKAAVKSAVAGSPAQQFFGETLPALQGKMTNPGTPSAKKERLLVDAFLGRLAFFDLAGTKFRVNLPGKDATHFYAVFVSAQEGLHGQFKETLLPYSDVQEDGVPLMGVNLKPLKLLVPEYHQYLEFSQHKLVEDLRTRATDFHNQPLEKIYLRHHLGTPYSKPNYKLAYETLKAEGAVTFQNPKTAQLIHKLTFDCRIKYVK